MVLKTGHVNTVACIVPTENLNTSAAPFHTFTIKEESIPNGSQLYATVEDENLTWKVDRVVNDTKLLEQEISRLTTAAIDGYNSAYFTTSMSDGHKHDMNKQRNQTVQIIFDLLKSSIDDIATPVLIEFAFLGIKNGECYDIRKKITRSNESMEKRNIDSIMKQADSIDAIRDLVIDRETTLPHILSIKLTVEKFNLVGSFTLIDLMYSPFAHTARDNTINAIQDITSALTTPKYTGLMQLGSSFIAKEISKHICGHNELLMILYLNDKIVNESQSRETLLLLSLVTAFTDMSIRSFPNEITNNDTELKTLRKEIKKLTIDRSNLEKLKQQLSLQLQETNSKIEKLLSEKKKFESEILMDGGEQVDKDEQLDRHLAIKEYQIQCMEMTLMSKSFIHDFDIQQLKTEIARLNTMLDIKDFSSEDIARNSKKVELDYERLLSQVQQRIQDHSNRLEEMHKMERELQNKLNRTELNSPIIEHKEISTEIDKKIPTQDDIEELEDIQMEADKELDRKIENVRDELSRVDQKLEESIRQRYIDEDLFQEKIAKAKEPVELIERENSEKISAVKKKAQDRIKVLTEKLDERYVSLRDHIKQLKQAIAEEQNNGSANKKRKIAPDVDDEEDEEEEKKDEEKDMEKDEEEDDEGEVDEPISKN